MAKLGTYFKAKELSSSIVISNSSEASIDEA
jgi:hypothetical protein